MGQDDQSSRRSRQARQGSDPEERLSRFLSMLLRHRPHVAGLDPDAQGWVPLPELVEKLQASWKKGPVSQEIIRRIVEQDEKGRYQIDTTGRHQRIRAVYGHSIEVQIDRPSIDPPKFLYHGTARRFLSKILSEGLRPMGRQYVHLSEHPENAVQVGQRRDSRPALLRITAGRMGIDGHEFYKSQAGIYLIAWVPPHYLQVEEAQ